MTWSSSKKALNRRSMQASKSYKRILYYAVGHSYCCLALMHIQTHGCSILTALYQVFTEETWLRYCSLFSRAQLINSRWFHAMPCYASSCGLLQDEKKEGKKRIAVPWYVRQRKLIEERKKKRRENLEFVSHARVRSIFRSPGWTFVNLSVHCPFGIATRGSCVHVCFWSLIL